MSWITRQLGTARVVCTDAAVGDVVTRGTDGSGPVWLAHQVHGADLVAVPAGGIESATADALITDVPNTALGVRTADCVPVVLVADDGDAIAVVHSGWPGTLAGVVPRAIDALRRGGANTIDAVIGPCIRACSYEFGADQLRTFVNRFGSAVHTRTAWGTDALDLVAAVRTQLEAGDVASIDDVEIDTFTSTAHCSYRRDATSDRNVTLAWIRG